YLDAAAPDQKVTALAAFDAAPSTDAAIVAARAVIAAHASDALRAFPTPSPRYILVAPPAANIGGLRPYLAGQRTLSDGRALYGALNIRRAQGAPSIEYWSTNLSHQEPSVIAREALRTAMRHEALALHGVDQAEANRLDALEPATQQFDPRPSA